MTYHKKKENVITKERLDRLNTLFGVGLAGFEGVIESFDDVIDKRVRESFHNATTPSPNDIEDHIISSIGGIPPNYPTAGNPYQDTFKKYHSIGLEEEKIYDEGLYFRTLIDGYDEVLHYITSNGTQVPVECDGIPLKNLWVTRRCEQKLRHLNLPILDLARLGKISHKGHRLTYFSHEHLPYLEEIYTALRPLLEDRFTDRRTVFGAKRFIDVMDSENIKHAALIYGAEHGNKNRRISFPSEFTKRGVSYIAITPNVEKYPPMH